MKEKEALRAKFSSDPDRYYKVDLFEREGFIRKRCSSCGKHFWTLEPERSTCPEQPCQFYEFLGNPPAKVRLDYTGTWKVVEDFFARNGHAKVRRYPVVCRWRPDLFFTVASIIDFQRVEGGKVVFELPANPLIVPQMCLRFNDLHNVGVSGKHYSSFCMIGQVSLADGEGYWKDACIDLDYELLTKDLGIPPRDVVFLEDVWLGYGAFGYSLEYHVRGLELGNAVFTEFEGTPENYREMKEKVIDMGAGLERFTWVTQGTPTSYDCAFGPVVGSMIDRCGVEYDADFFLKYSRVAGTLSLDDTADIATAKRSLAQRLGVSFNQLEKKIAPLEAIYAIADHVRTLVFAIADGALPSNVGGGYNLRVVFRRALDFLQRFKWNITLDEVAEWHIDYLKAMYPELEEHRAEVATILEVEKKRYQSTKGRIGKIAGGLAKSSKPPTEEDLIRLYDSEGITPQLLTEAGLKFEIPADFYAKVAARHDMPRKAVEEPFRFDVEDLPPTKFLFYEDQNLFEFEDTVLKVFNGRYVVLRRTAFYPRSGGQEPDLGRMGECEVVDVEKYGNVVVHELKACNLREGDRVRCLVDAHRRWVLMRHHTATHIVNGAARRLLGSWVWQHSAYKDVDKARLDITHYAHLTREELLEIERLANGIVLQNLPVLKEVLPRGEAEARYGFQIYQGGITPGQDVRILNIAGWDVEACGGTHCFRTGDVGLIKMLKSERVQDGVERLEFVAGEAALKVVEKQEQTLLSIQRAVDAPQEKVVEAVSNMGAELEGLRRQQKLLAKRLSSTLLKELPASSQLVDGVELHVSEEESLDDDFHITLGEQATNANPNLVYCAVLLSNGRVKVLVFSGKAAQKRGVSASGVAREVARVVGGSGGGDRRFGQGGGSMVDKMEEAKRAVKSAVLKALGAEA